MATKTVSLLEIKEKRKNLPIWFLENQFARNLTKMRRPAKSREGSTRNDSDLKKNGPSWTEKSI